TGKPYFDPTFDYLGFRSTQKAAQAAYAMAGVTARDIDFAEVHDCFTWTEISNTEDLGFCKKGEGGKLAEEGRTALDGDIPITPSGGLKSFGHPIGASGVRMIYEVVTQPRGEAGARQVKNPEVGVAHNVGGPGPVAGGGVLALLPSGPAICRAVQNTAAGRFVLGRGAAWIVALGAIAIVVRLRRRA